MQEKYDDLTLYTWKGKISSNEKWIIYERKVENGGNERQMEQERKEKAQNTRDDHFMF